MWFITQCFGVGFRCSHQAGDSVPLPGPPDPPDMAPDPHDEEDFEGNNTSSLMDEFMSKIPVFSLTFYVWTVMRSQLQQCVQLHSALHAGAPESYWIRRKIFSLFVIQLRCAVSCKRNVSCCLIPTGRLVIDARKGYISSIYLLYSCHMTTSFHLYTDSILVI